MQKTLKFNFKQTPLQILLFLIIAFSHIAHALEGPITIQGRVFMVNKEIATGGEGTVYEVQDTQSPYTLYALKVQKISEINPYEPMNPIYQANFNERENHFDFFRNRIRNLPQDLKKAFAFMPLTFDHIIHLPEPKFINAAKPEIRIRSGVILMPLAEDTLNAEIKRLNENLGLTIEQQQLARSKMAIQVFSQIIKELHILSVNSYSYLDLKPLNVAYSPQANTYSLLDLNSIFSTIHKEDAHRTMLATPIYAAPEIARSNRYSEISQLYSLAITLLEVLDSSFLDKIRFRLLNQNNNYYDQTALERLEKSYLNSFAHIDREKIAHLFLFIKAASEKDPYVRSQKLNELSFSPEILDIVKKADAKQSRVSKLMESLKEKIKSTTQSSSNSKKTCDGLFH